MKMQSFRYIAPQCLKSMRNNGWMTFAAIVTITIALFLCSSFWMLLRNLDANAVNIEQDVRVAVYLNRNLTITDRMEVEQQLRWIDGIATVEFVSRDEGIKGLQDRYGGSDLVESLGGVNPLPDMYYITAQNTDMVSLVRDAAAKIEGVDEAKYGEETVEKLFTLTGTMRKVGIAIMLLLALSAVILIAMATRLTIQTRKKEIMVMKWVGATNAFIRWPFFLEGMILGVAGAVIALVVMLSLYTGAVDYVGETIAFVQVLPLAEVWAEAALFTLASGLLLGALGSFIPLAKFLDV